MFWSARENLGGLKHFMTGFHRAVFRVPATRHFQRLSMKYDAKTISLRVDDDNNPVTCKGCGYAILTITFANDWQVETCSASLAQDWLENEKLKEWVLSMPRACVTSDLS